MTASLDTKVGVAPGDGAPGKKRRGWGDTYGLWMARVASWVALIGVWQLLSTYVVEPFILPPPSRVAAAMVDIARSGKLVEDFGASLGRLMYAFVLFFTIGALLGVLMAVSRWWEDFLRDSVSMAISMPGLVFILIVLLIFGSSGFAPIVAVVLAVAPYVTLQIWEGVKAVPGELLEMGNAFKMGRWKSARHIIVPALIPFTVTAATHGISLGWRLVVLAELFGGSNGIGFQMRDAFSRFQIRNELAWALFFIVFALILDRAVLAPVSKRALRWRS
jgi:NitT/TauT family transport system permease protein